MRIEAISEPMRLDGMQLCMGCEERFVLSGFCGDCTQLNEIFERKRLAGEFIVAGGREAFGELPRVDVGTVEYARPLRHQELTLGQYIAGAAVALVLCVPTCVGLWFLGKAAITFLSGVSR